MSTARIKGAQTQLDYMPRDGHALAAQGFATLIRVAQGPDTKQAVVAALALIECGERLLQQKAAKQPEPVKAFQQSRSELLDELKGLYARALGTPPLVVEAESAESIPANRD